MKIVVPCTDLASLGCSDAIGSAFTAAVGFPINVGAVNYTAGQTTSRDRGIYAQSSYGLTDQLKLIGGVRYTWDEQTNEATRISYSFPTTPPFTGPAVARCTDLSTNPTCSQTLEQKS